MTTYMELSVMSRGLYGVCGILLVLGAVFLLAGAAMLHIGRRYLCYGAVLTAAVMFVLQGITDARVYLEGGIKILPFCGKTMGHLPWAVTALLFTLFAAAEILFLSVILRRKKHLLTAGAIKESLDALPDGVCFYAGDGLPLLVNRQMNRISGELFDSEILNAGSFFSRLKEKAVSSGTKVIRTEPTVIIETADGKVWDFHRNILTVGKTKVNELLASDITVQYRLNQEFAAKNEVLNRINERLRQYSREIKNVISDKELLTAKIQVHDDVGRSLLAFRTYCRNRNQESCDRNKLLFLWRTTIGRLKNEGAGEQEHSDWEILLKAAETIGVAIELKGQLPESDENRALLLAALHECLTNTVKHAGGNKMYVSVREDETALTAEITNNGTPPSGEIRESGGLKNLRHTVETAGGVMKIKSTPHFVLRIVLVKGLDTEWKK